MEQATVEAQRVLTLGLTERAREDVEWVLLSEFGVQLLAFVSTVMDLGISFKHRILYRINSYEIRIRHSVQRCSH
jgi:hypothetical protein